MAPTRPTQVVLEEETMAKKKPGSLLRLPKLTDQQKLSKLPTLPKAPKLKDNLPKLKELEKLHEEEAKKKEK